MRIYIRKKNSGNLYHTIVYGVSKG